MEERMLTPVDRQAYPAGAAWSDRPEGEVGPYRRIGRPGPGWALSSETGITKNDSSSRAQRSMQ